MKFAIAIAQEALPAEPVLFRGDIIRSMEKAKALGYDAVEIHDRDAARLNGDAILQCSEATGIGVSALATGMAKRVDGLTFISDDDAVRQAAVRRVHGFIDLAARFGAGIIIGSLRGLIPDLARRDVYDRRFRECLDQVLERAERSGVDILLEVINRYENNYLNTVAETLAYLDPIPSRHVKLHIDTFHMNIEETDMAAAIRASGKRLGYIHVADNTRLYPGSGSLDFARIFAALQDAGYSGYVSLECLALPDSDTAAAKAIATMNAIYPRR
ncbi:MAG: sugar phosphate isomerase/epimerase [Planctomycetes bacterium]|nr:sugar phosphate isomerase/epimerase [Planctomycetota bacterium]